MSMFKNKNQINSLTYFLMFIRKSIEQKLIVVIFWLRSQNYFTCSTNSFISKLLTSFKRRHLGRFMSVERMYLLLACFCAWVLLVYCILLDSNNFVAFKFQQITLRIKNRSKLHNLVNKFILSLSKEQMRLFITWWDIRFVKYILEKSGNDLNQTFYKFLINLAVILLLYF